MAKLPSPSYVKLFPIHCKFHNPSIFSFLHSSILSSSTSSSTSSSPSSSSSSSSSPSPSSSSSSSFSSSRPAQVYIRYKDYRTQSVRHHTTMSASASQVKLSLDHSGVYHLPGLTQQSAAKASQLLQENHENHHIFFNRDGFHSKSADYLYFPRLFPITHSTCNPSDPPR